MVIKYYCIEMSQIGKQHFKKNDVFVKKKKFYVESMLLYSFKLLLMEMSNLSQNLFKGTGKCTLKLTTPPRIHYQWADKGSYHLQELLETIKHLPN